MIVKSGRKHIVKNGFNPSDIKGFFYGNAGDGAQVVTEDDAFSYTPNNNCYLSTDISSNEIFFNTTVSNLVISPSTNNNADTVYTITATLDNSSSNYTLDTFGLFVGDVSNPVMFSRVTFPEYTVKNSCTLQLTYYLYF